MVSVQIPFFGTLLYLVGSWGFVGSKGLGLGLRLDNDDDNKSGQTLNALILAILVANLCSKELFLNDKYLLIWDCKEFSQTEKPDLSSNKTRAFIVKCLLSTSLTQTVFISAVPERGDAEGEGAGGPGGWRVQEAGGRGQQGGGGKEVSRKWGNTSEKPSTGEYQGSIYFRCQMAWFLSLPLFAPSHNLCQCLVNCVFVCGM